MGLQFITVTVVDVSCNNLRPVRYVVGIKDVYLQSLYLTNKNILWMTSVTLASFFVTSFTILCIACNDLRYFNYIFNFLKVKRARFCTMTNNHYFVSSCSVLQKLFEISSWLFFGSIGPSTEAFCKKMNSVKMNSFNSMT